MISSGKYKEGVEGDKTVEGVARPEYHRAGGCVPAQEELHLMFEFMESDLEAVIRDRNIFLSPADYKSYMRMTLKGLAVCHKKWILHRDLKPNNLLLDSNSW